MGGERGDGWSEPGRGGGCSGDIGRRAGDIKWTGTCFWNWQEDGEASRTESANGPWTAGKRAPGGAERITTESASHAGDLRLRPPAPAVCRDDGFCFLWVALPQSAIPFSGIFSSPSAPGAARDAGPLPAPPQLSASALANLGRTSTHPDARAVTSLSAVLVARHSEHTLNRIARRAVPRAASCP